MVHWRTLPNKIAKSREVCLHVYASVHYFYSLGPIYFSNIPAQLLSPCPHISSLPSFGVSVYGVHVCTGGMQRPASYHLPHQSLKTWSLTDLAVTVFKLSWLTKPNDLLPSSSPSQDTTGSYRFHSKHFYPVSHRPSSNVPTKWCLNLPG